MDKSNQGYKDFSTLHKSMSLNEIETYRRTLAKRANQRLRTLEKAGVKTSEMEAVTWLKKKGKTRFKETANTPDYNELKSEVTQLSNFLRSWATTIRGRKKTMEKLKQTFKNKGFDLDDKTLELLLDNFDKFKSGNVRYEVSISNILAVTDQDTTTKQLKDLIKLTTSKKVGSEQTLKNEVEKYIEKKKSKKTGKLPKGLNASLDKEGNVTISNDAIEKARTAIFKKV